MDTRVFLGMICAGIVTYNPELLRLQHNIDAVADCGIKKIIIIDNGSDNYSEIQTLTDKYDCIVVVNNKHNEGIACALNQVFEVASKDITIRWVLTLDQDSIVNNDIIEKYAKYYVEGQQIASITSLRHDRAYSRMQKHKNTPTEYVNRCITSGNLVLVDAWRQIHGFDNRLFIDMVDYDFCYRLREMNYNILRINEPCILHELGKPTIVKFWGKERYVYNHSAFRKYYICRNYVYLLRNYRAYSKKEDSYYFLVKLFIKTFLYENDDKANKLKEMIKGTLAGFKLKRIEYYQ